MRFFPDTLIPDHVLRNDYSEFIQAFFCSFQQQCIIIGKQLWKRSAMTTMQILEAP
jgi:hypothetical protein